jgi:hypothetical protein
MQYLIMCVKLAQLNTQYIKVVKLPAGHDAAGCKDSLVAEASCHHSPSVLQAATRCRERGYLAGV